MIKAAYNKTTHLELSQDAISKMEIVKINIEDNTVNLRIGNNKYHCKLLKKCPEENSYFIKVNGTLIELEKKHHYSDIISKISKYTNSDQKINKLVSPMPGLILEIQTKAGEKVKKDEPLIILEAMKMENVLCSPVDGIIREILVNTKQTVEKNSVLIKFDI